MMITYLERHNDEKNIHRFYRLAICPTLFGEYALVREWGRCTGRLTYGKRGRRMEQWFSKETEAQVAAEKVKARKCKKGYQVRLFM